MVASQSANASVVVQPRQHDVAALANFVRSMSPAEIDAFLLALFPGLDAETLEDLNDVLVASQRRDEPEIPAAEVFAGYDQNWGQPE